MKQQKQLYVNDQLVDMPDVDLQYSLQINDVGRPQSMQANYTLQFELPLTQRNRVILGFPDNIPADSDTPYQQHPAKYVVAGVEIIPNGFLEIQNIQNNIVYVQLLAGSADFLELIGYQVYDMGDSTSAATDYGRKLVWKSYNDCYWNVSNAAYSQAKTSGWIWPVIDWGQVPEVGWETERLNVLGMRPAFFLKTAIELLVQSTGYRINPKSCIISNPKFAALYEKILIPYAGNDFTHGSDWQNSTTGTGPLYTTSVNTILHQGNPPAVGYLKFDQGNYIAADRKKFTATLTFDFYMRGVIGTSYPASVNVNFYFKSPDGSEHLAATKNFELGDGSTRLPLDPFVGPVAEQAFKNNKLSYTFEFVKDMELFVKWDFNHVGLGLKDTYAIIYSGATLTLDFDKKTVLYGEQIQCERILPDISQREFLNYTLQKFGLFLVANPNDGTVTFASFADVIANIPHADDWSGKVKDVGRNISFKLNNFSQINYLRYTQDSGVSINYIPRYFADSEILINDKTLNPTQKYQDLFTLPYAPSRNRPYFGGTIAQILKIDTTNPGVEFTISTEPRILIDQKFDLRTLAKTDGTGPSVTFWSGNDDAPDEITINDIISVPYFWKEDAPDLGEAARQLAWCDKTAAGVTYSGKQPVMPGLQSVYYPEYQKALTKVKLVTKYVYLTPLDIAELDFLIPKYFVQDNAFYFINKIDSWVPGHPVKVDLLKLY